MQHLTYAPIHPQDVMQIQQMIQGTEFTSMTFNRYSHPIFVAHQSCSIVGFCCGQIGYGTDAHVLTLHGTYLRHHLDDPQHENELHLAFINWAEKNLGVTHYKIGEFDAAKPIGISHMIPPPATDIPCDEDATDGMVGDRVADRTFEYH